MSSSFRLVYWFGLDLIGPSSLVLQAAPLYLRTLWCYVFSGTLNPTLLLLLLLLSSILIFTVHRIIQNGQEDWSLVQHCSLCALYCTTRTGFVAFYFSFNFYWMSESVAALMIVNWQHRSMLKLCRGPQWQTKSPYTCWPKVTVVTTFTPCFMSWHCSRCFIFCLQYSGLSEYEDDEISLHNLAITKDRGMLLLNYGNLRDLFYFTTNLFYFVIT